MGIALSCELSCPQFGHSTHRRPELIDDDELFEEEAAGLLAELYRRFPWIEELADREEEEEGEEEP